jgi:hypothetical protein
LEDLTRAVFNWSSRVAIGVACVLVTALPLAADSPEAAFLAENDAAMVKMHRDMHTKPSGDVDRDFVNMMVPHHQGAIDMAQAVLRYGHDDRIRRLAQEIIVEQQQEIQVMRMTMVGSISSTPAAKHENK